MDSFPSINNHSDNNNIRSIKPESKYERLRRIGIGSYGVVFKCVNRQSGQIVAIKRYSENDSDPIIRRIAMREVKMLRHLKHPNLINLIEVFRRKRRLHLVFDYCELTVLDVIEKYANNCPLNLIKKIIWQTVNGINYCHTHNCIHRDIKPENILINQSGIVKLCDFGFARNTGKSLGEEKNFNFSKQPGALIHAAKSYARNDNNNNHGLNSETNPKESQYNIQERQALTEYVATRWYRAPELLIGDIFYDIKIDIWAIGCVTAELMKGEPMWPGKTDADQLCLIKSSLGQLTPSQQNTLLNQSIYDQNTIEKILTQPASLGEALNRKLPVLKIGHSGLDFVSSCLRMDPLKRPDSGELLKHPYIFSSRMSQFMVQNNFSSHHRKRTSLAEPRRFSLINSQSLTMLASNKASPIKRDPIQAKPVVFNSKTKSQIPTKDTSKKVTTTSDNFSSISIKAPAKPTANDSKTAAHKGEDKENFKQKSSINKPMLNFDNSELNSGQKNKRADETKLIGMKKINPLGENKISNQYHLRDGTKCDSNRQAINGNVLQVNAKQTAAAAKKRADSSATSTSTTDTPENPSANRLKSSYQSISFLPSVVPQLQRRNNSALPMRRGAN